MTRETMTPSFLLQLSDLLPLFHYIAVFSSCSSLTSNTSSTVQYHYIPKMRVCTLFLLLVPQVVTALNVVLPGGTGPMGQILASRLSHHDVTILTRNSFLAGAPNRVTNEFGWVGATFLKKNPHVRLRDWDGGDLLDIVGSDWLGWQDDALVSADVVVHLVGGYTEQRTMACERIVRESLMINPNALQVSVSPTEEELASISPGMATLKKERLRKCEDLVKLNCPNAECLRLESFQLEKACDAIQKVIDELAAAVVVEPKAR
jgi:hypothetical protein